MAKKLIVETAPSRCPACQSTARTGYQSTTEHAIAGELEDGRPYTHVVWRRTACRKCGQHRIDRSYENRPVEEAAVAGE